MPPKSSKTQRKAASSSNQEVCCICCQKIGPKDEVLFCSGSCQKFLHRYCASVSDQSFTTLSSAGASPFLCFCCYKARNDNQVAELLSIVDSLKGEINALKAASTENTDASTSEFRLSQPVLSAGETTNSPTAAAKCGEPPTPKITHFPPNSDKKFNVVLYCVNECPSGMSRSARLDSDLSTVVKVVAGIHRTIQPESIKDCFRLGKFTANASRPRPILVKFIRMADVTSILSKKRDLSHPYSIKPDMPHDQRLRNSIIMKERWSLIQSGVHRNRIKIKNDHLFVNNRLYGHISNNKFVLESEAFDVSTMDVAVDVPSIVEESLLTPCTSSAHDQQITSADNTKSCSHHIPKRSDNNHVSSHHVSITSDNNSVSVATSPDGSISTCSPPVNVPQPNLATSQS